MYSKFVCLNWSLKYWSWLEIVWWLAIVISTATLFKQPFWNVANVTVGSMQSPTTPRVAIRRNWQSVTTDWRTMKAWTSSCLLYRTAIPYWRCGDIWYTILRLYAVLNSLQTIGKMFVNVGMCQQAVTALLKVSPTHLSASVYNHCYLLLTVCKSSRSYWRLCTTEWGNVM